MKSTAQASDWLTEGEYETAVQFSGVANARYFESIRA